MSDNTTRRDVLRLTACAAAALAAPVSAVPGGTQDQTMRLSREVRVAIIGLENHISEILEVVKASPQVRLTAVADKNPDLLGEKASDPLIRKAKPYSDYRDLLDREQLDVVAVCGENATRAAIVQACAERKLNVVAEKPLAITMGDLDRIRKTIERSGSALTLLLPMRFSAVYQKMRSIIMERGIGEVVTVAAQKSYKLGDRPDWMKSRSSFGGIIPYIGIHMIDLMRWTSGHDFVEAAAFQSNVGAPQIREMENNAGVVFRLDNGGTGSLRLDYLRPASAPTHGDDRLRVAGTAGVVEYQEGRGVSLVTTARKTEQITDLPPEKNLFADFLEALYSGGKHLISLQDVFRVSEIVLKVRDAADTGTVVRL